MPRPNTVSPHYLPRPPAIAAGDRRSAEPAVAVAAAGWPKIVFSTYVSTPHHPTKASLPAPQARNLLTMEGLEGWQDPSPRQEWGLSRLVSQQDELDRGWTTKWLKIV